MEEKKKIKIKNINIPKNCNWNEINIEYLKDVNNLIIEIDNLEKDTNEDMKKIEFLKSLMKLKNIEIKTKNPKYIEYFDILLKEFSVPKSAKLIDDFENKDRSDINFDELHYDKIVIPTEYAQWGINKKYLERCDYWLAYVDEFCEQNIEILEKEINEWLKIPDLTLVDKVVLVANYLQKNMQYVQGEVSEAKGKKYIAKGIKESDYGGFDKVSTMLKYHIGHCQAFSKIAMLMLNNPKMNVNCRLMGGPGHVYNIIYDDNKAYGLDATWGITRNPNRVDGMLKATAFYDGYILFGQKELEEMNQSVDHHTPLCPLKVPIEATQVSREEIKKSREKLEKYGIEFVYPGITYVQQIECDENTIMPSEIEKITKNVTVLQKEKAHNVVTKDSNTQKSSKKEIKKE